MINCVKDLTSECFLGIIEMFLSNFLKNRTKKVRKLRLPSGRDFEEKEA